MSLIEKERSKKTQLPSCCHFTHFLDE